MSKVAVVYWTGTGNTESMAKLVAQGAVNAGAEAEVFFCTDFSGSMMDDYDAVAFGCPAMGAEELDGDEFEPVFSDCRSKLSGKTVGLFGSYGWGDGEWMRLWEADCRSNGAKLVSEGIISCGAPDGEEGALMALGAALV